jgi:hypothetical protein
MLYSQFIKLVFDLRLKLNRRRFKHTLVWINFWVVALKLVMSATTRYQRSCEPSLYRKSRYKTYCKKCGLSSKYMSSQWSPKSLNNQHTYEEVHVVHRASNCSSKLLQPNRINETYVIPDIAVFLNVDIHGRSRVRFPMVSLDFFIDIILSVALWPCGQLNL